MIMKSESIAQEVEFCEMVATNAASSVLLLLINKDSSFVYVRSWMVMIKKLLSCSLPIGRLTLKDFKMDEETVQFLCSVNPLCFSSTVVTFDNVDFSAVPNSFVVLLDKLLNPKAVQLRGIRGLPSCSLSMALSNILSLSSVDCLHLLGLVHPAAGLRIDFAGVLQFLQSSDEVGKKEVFLEMVHLKMGIEEIWQQLFQSFIADTKKSNYKLAIRCAEGTALPRDRGGKNLRTGEQLTMQLLRPSQNSSTGRYGFLHEVFVIFLRVSSTEIFGLRNHVD